MADKPTTPDPAGGGRRKRTAPTIDLKATEVSTTSKPPDAETGEKPDRTAHAQSAEAKREALAIPMPKASGLRKAGQRCGKWWRRVARVRRS
jgi:hypothetical protein